MNGIASRLLGAGLLLLMSGTVWPSAAAEFPFAKDETIELIVPYRPGGGYDRVTRLVQPALAKALSEQAGHEVTVVVENKTGAGGRVAYEYLYGSPAEAARLVLLDNQAAGLQQVALGAAFDLAKFTYIGRVNNSKTAIQVRADLGIDSMQALIERARQKPILFGTAGAGSSGHIATLIVQAILKDHGVELPMDFVHFNGSKEVLASMRRGEAEAFLGSVSSTISAVREGYAVNCVVFDEARSRFDPEAPTALEQEVPGAQIITESTRTSRIFIAPPTMTAPRAQSLREGLNAALHSRALLDAAETARLPIVYGSAEASKKAVMRHSATLSKYETLVRETLAGQ